MRFWFWIYKLTHPTGNDVEPYAPDEEISAHGQMTAVRRYSLIRELETEYGRDKEYPSEDWMNRRLKERQVRWRVKKQREHWQTYDPKYANLRGSKGMKVDEELETSLDNEEAESNEK